MVTSPPRRAQRFLFHFWVLLCLGLAVLSACSDTAGVAVSGDRTAAAEEKDQGAARDCRYAESSCSQGFQCSEVEGGRYECLPAQDPADQGGGDVADQRPAPNDVGPIADQGLPEEMGRAADAGPARCAMASECESGVCGAEGLCLPPSCTDNVQNGAESDVDCGGDCPACADGAACLRAEDCLDGRCEAGRCAAPSCEDGTQNGGESDVDCGGPCDPCALGAACQQPADCESGFCSPALLCEPDRCGDGVLDPGEACDDGNQENSDQCSARCEVIGVDCAAGCDPIGTHRGQRYQASHVFEGTMEANQYFGSLIAMEGDWFMSVAGRATVHIFKRRGLEWRRTQTLQANSAEPLISSLILEQGMLIIGQRGLATSYQLDGESWSPVQTLETPAEVSCTYLRLSRFGDLLLSDWCLFRLEEGRWRFHQQLALADGRSPPVNDCEIREDFAFLGEYQYNSLEARSSGAVHVFQRMGEVWQYSQTLLTQNPLVFDGLGLNITAHGSNMVASSYGDHSGAGQDSSGTLHFFEEQNGRWRFAETLRSPDPYPHELFGLKTILRDDLLIVAGANNVNGLGPDADLRPGKVYLYERQDGRWQLRETLMAPENAERNFFGHDLSFSDGEIAISAMLRDLVYLYQLAPQCTEAGACLCIDGAAGPQCTERPLCGDGTRQPVERCDDGNQEWGDGCDELCWVE